MLAWGAWDLAGEAGGGVLIAWVSVPALELPGGDALTAQASAFSAWGAGEAGEGALIAWISAPAWDTSHLLAGSEHAQ